MLVHCQAGISRSASIVLSYLVANQKMSLKEALGYAKARKPNIQPNEGKPHLKLLNHDPYIMDLSYLCLLGFLTQLIEYEKEILGSSSLTLTEYYVEVFASYVVITSELVTPSNQLTWHTIAVWASPLRQQEVH